MWTAALIIAGSYLLSAVPVAYLTGRLLGGVDLRELGSRNVGASNVWQTVSRAAVVPVGLAEIGQGLIGPMVAKAAGQGDGVQVAAGLAAIAGHIWSPYLGFTGGRGVGHAIGFMLAMSRSALGGFIVLSLAGVALRIVPQLVGLGIFAAPLIALGRHEPPAVVGGMATMAALLFAKRIIAHEPPPPGGRGRRVVLNRILYDRDTRERERWVRGGARDR